MRQHYFTSFLLKAASVTVIATGPSWATALKTAVSPATMPFVTTIDERFESYNVEMAEVIGGKFWKPYSDSAPVNAAAPMKTFEIGSDPALFEKRAPVNLQNARLRKLAAALGPAYIRVSGTWANTVYFQNDDAPAAKVPSGFTGVLTRTQWASVVQFANAVDAKLVTSFAIGAGVRDAAGIWTPIQARLFAAYTKSIGGAIAAAELFNEPTIAASGGAPTGYDATTFVRDQAVFLPFAGSDVLNMKTVGPGSVGEGGTALVPPSMAVLHSPDLLGTAPQPKFDVFSYHFYGAVSNRCAAMGPNSGTTRDAALSEDWLSRTEKTFDFYKLLHDQYEPNTPIWITETADAACGGNPWAATFLDSFRYVNQMGTLAKRGVSVIIHNTLASSEYGLLDQKTFAPRPNYWAALLWRRLMGQKVLDAGASHEGFHIYAQCLRGHAGGVTLLIINNSRTESNSISLGLPSERYTLSAPTVQAADVELNGQLLKLQSDDQLPALAPKREPSGEITLAPSSITFLALPTAGNIACTV